MLYLNKNITEQGSQTRGLSEACGPQKSEKWELFVMLIHFPNLFPNLIGNWRFIFITFSMRPSRSFFRVSCGPESIWVWDLCHKTCALSFFFNQKLVPFCPSDFPYPYLNGFRCCWSFRNCMNGDVFGFSKSCCYNSESITCPTGIGGCKTG